MDEPTAILARFLDAHPEEATTLGLRSYDDRWAARSVDDLEQRARQCRSDLRALEGESDSLDTRMLRAHLRAEARRWERGDVCASLEHGVLLHAIARFQSMQCRSEADWERLATRVSGLPSALAQQEALLRRGASAGRPADSAIAKGLLTHELPQLISDLERLAGWPADYGMEAPRCAASLASAGAAAARAYRRHALFLEEEIVSSGIDSYALGRAEVAERLEHELGLGESPEALAARFERQLPELDEELLSACQAAAQQRGERIAELGAARALVGELFGATLSEGVDPLARYAEHLARAERFCVERGLYRLPPGYDLRITPMPPHRIGHVSSTNWPAPPRDRAQAGHLLVSPRPSDHSVANLELLAVHEATPGHYLQSVGFQSHFAAHETVPARLLGMTDDVAMASCFFGPMLAIEGFAVRAEEVMDDAGFFAPDTRVIEAASRVIRALRVVTDLRLHTGEMTREQAAELLSSRTGFPLGWARGQALRYTRIPLQAITYAVGADRFAACEAKQRQELGAAFEMADFHDSLIAAGPVPPDWVFGSSEN